MATSSRPNGQAGETRHRGRAKVSIQWRGARARENSQRQLDISTSTKKPSDSGTVARKKVRSWYCDCRL
eukprot:3873323-Amphidinium_carterae.1